MYTVSNALTADGKRILGQALRRPFRKSCKVIKTQAWQIEETMKAIREADAGNFATDEELRAFRAKWV